MPRGAMEMVLDGAGLEYSPAQNGLSTGRSCSRGWRGTGQDGETGDVGKVGSERAEEPGPALGSPGEPWGALGFVWDTAPRGGGGGGLPKRQCYTPTPGRERGKADAASRARSTWPPSIIQPRAIRSGSHEPCGHMCLFKFKLIKTRRNYQRGHASPIPSAQWPHGLVATGRDRKDLERFLPSRETD